jgi:hypothetical protein
VALEAEAVDVDPASNAAEVVVDSMTPCLSSSNLCLAIVRLSLAIANSGLAYVNLCLRRAKPGLATVKSGRSHSLFGVILPAVRIRMVAC